MSFTLFKRGDEFIATSDYTTQTQHIKEVVMELENMLTKMIGHINDHS